MWAATCPPHCGKANQGMAAEAVVQAKRSGKMGSHDLGRAITVAVEFAEDRRAGESKARRSLCRRDLCFAPARDFAPFFGVEMRVGFGHGDCSLMPCTDFTSTSQFQLESLAQLKR
jgi:hypothetical protein